MRAAVLYSPRRLVVKDVESPRPGPGEVLIRVRSVGICPSDLRFYTGAGSSASVPLGEESYGLTAHEWSGEVVEVGPGVEGLEVGDHVVPDFLVPCGRCRYCARGLTNLCPNRRTYFRGFAEYAVAYAENTYRVPGGVDFDQSFLTEPLSCVLNANEIAGIGVGDVVVVVGAGPMGLLNIQVSKMSGGLVVASDPIEERLRAARRMGADIAVNPGEEDLREVVDSASDGYGADVVIVTVGNGRVIEESARLLAKAGKLILFAGVYPPSEVSLNPNQIHYHQIQITGSYDHQRHHFLKALELISRGRIKVRELITHVFPLERIEDGFRVVEERRGLKVLIKP